MNLTTIAAAAMLMLIFINISSADTGNSSSFKFSMQTNNLAGNGSSSNYVISVDSGSTGTGSSSDYRLYLGYASFGAKFEQVPYPPIVNLTGLAGESVIYQSTTARFQISAKNLWAINSTVVPRLYIYDSSGGLVFQRTGTSATLEAGSTVSLLQYSTLVFSVGSTSAGTYNATVNLLYTDEKNATQTTNNRSILFEIRAVSTSDTGSTTSGGSSSSTPVAETESVEDTSAGETASIAISNSARLGVEAIEFTPTDDVSDVQITVSEASAPDVDVIPQDSGAVYKYLEISKTNIGDAQISSAKINFKVPKSWVSSTGIDKDTVALNRFKNDEWSKLPTAIRNEDSYYFYYSATSPGFSRFAITGERLTGAGYIEITSIPLLVRITKGEGYEDSISISNPSSKQISGVGISAEGIPKDWVFIGEAVDIEPYGGADVPIIIRPPNDAAAGTYTVNLVASNGEASDTASFVLRLAEQVKLTSPSGEAVEKGLSINKVAKVKEGSTYFTLKLKNGGIGAKKLSFVENIDKTIAKSSDDITFVGNQPKILEKDPKVEWLFQNVAANEERNVTYFVKKIVKSTEPVFYPSIEDVTVVTGEVVIQQQQEFNIDYGVLRVAMLVAFAFSGMLALYKFHPHIRRRVQTNGMKRFAGKPILTAETGRKLGIVEDITFMPATGELLDVVVKKPTAYAERLLVKRGANRFYIPFQSVKAVGDYIVITEKDIVFEAVLRKRFSPQKEQARIMRFYRVADKIKMPQNITKTKEKTSQKTLVQYMGPYKGFAPAGRKPGNIEATLKDIKRLYRDGMIDKKTYHATKKRLLEGLEHVGGKEDLIRRIRRNIPISLSAK